MKADATLKGPPAVWTAFALQGRWKSWLLAGQWAVIVLLIGAVYGLAIRPADVIVVSEDGTGAFVEASVASGALQSFLREQRGRASDVTLRAFSERFVKLTASINSTTVDDAWSEALSLMVPPLAQRLDAEAKSQRLLETYRLAQVRTAVSFKKLELVERRADKAHVRALVERQKEKLTGGGVSADTLQVDLVLAEVPRSSRRPDGLEVLDWRSEVMPSNDGSSARGPGADSPVPSQR